MIIFLTAAAIAVVAYFIYVSVIKPMVNYWEDRGVTHMKTWDQIKTFIQSFVLSKPILDLVKDSYNKFPDQRYYGTFFFTKPAIALRDLDLIKQISIKDFDHFTDHQPSVPPESDPLMGNNLFSLKGHAWRDMRSTLSPVFTSSKMKIMFVLMSDCAKDFTNYILEKHEGEPVEMEMKDLFTRYTNDVIATTAFGIKCDSLKEPENSFYLMGKEVTNFKFTVMLKIMLYWMFPKIMRFLKVRFFTKKVSNFFTNIIMETIQKREIDHIFRPDLIQLLMDSRKGNLKHETAKDTDVGFATVKESDLGKTEKKQKVYMTDVELTAQAMIFFFAGFDTSSTLMSFMAYELAVNPDIQKKLSDEVDETLEKCGKDVTYDAILKMKYLDQVLTETMRKWTPGFQTERICTEEYTMEPVNEHEKRFTIEKGTQVIIPIAGIHYDPKYWPNPEKFDPDRFSDENKGSIVSGSYLPFGIGPRNCIGSRFALLETKILFFHLLSKFEFVVGKKTVVPIKLARKFNLAIENGCWITLKPRNSTGQ